MCNLLSVSSNVNRPSHGNAQHLYDNHKLSFLYVVHELNAHRESSDSPQKAISETTERISVNFSQTWLYSVIPASSFTSFERICGLSVSLEAK